MGRPDTEPMNETPITTSNDNPGHGGTTRAWHRKVVALAGAALLIAPLAIVTSAGASVATTVSANQGGTKAGCLARLDQRVSYIATLQTRVSTSQHLTAAHAAALNTKLDAARSGLTALRATIVADTDRPTATADCLEQASDYRVYALLARQVHLVRAVDLEAFAATKVDRVTARIQHAIDTAAGTGKDVTAAKAALADIGTKVADANNKANGMADAVLAVTPASFNADHSALASVRTTAGAIRSDLAAIRADLAGIRKALRG